MSKVWFITGCSTGFGATWQWKHPDATAMGQKFKIPIAYNAAADTASWNEMKTFFTGLFK